MVELIKKYQELEKELEEVREAICDRLETGESFEFIAEGEPPNGYIVELKKVIDGITYQIICRDDIDHEYHNELFVYKDGETK